MNPRRAIAFPHQGGVPSHLLPIEGAWREGFGLPLVDWRGPAFDILLDGVPVDDVAAWSIPGKWVVRDLTDAQGRPVRQGNGVATERLTGDVGIRAAGLFASVRREGAR